MNIKEKISEINENREIYEAGFVMCLWKDPLLYQEYGNFNIGKDSTLTTDQGKFYYGLGRLMFKAGYKTFDATTCNVFLVDKPQIKDKFESLGGYDGIVKLQITMQSNNVEGFLDEIIKRNSLTTYLEKNEQIFKDTSIFNTLSSEDIYNAFENLNNSIALKSVTSENIEEININNDFINELKSGLNQGYSYNKFAPLLNYITSGCAPSSLYMLGAHSGVGKTSFAFGVLIMGLVCNGYRTAIISNEMNINSYRILLLEHILTRDMNYWGLTRKQLTLGNFSAEQEEKIQQAIKIQEERYKGLKFVKTYDNNMTKISKYLRKLKAYDDIQVVLLDTFKADDDVDTGTMWQSLMLDSRKLFKEADKLSICIITTYQLSLHTTNQRFLDATCLSAAKSIKEIYETMIYCRPMWDDEMTGEKHAVNPYKLSKDNPKIHEEVQIDPNKKQLLFFVDKNRADDDKQVLLYEVNTRYNYWTEKGFCKVTNDHRNY